MMCLMRDENEREREVIVMKDDFYGMNNTYLVNAWMGDMVDAFDLMNEKKKKSSSQIASNSNCEKDSTKHNRDLSYPGFDKSFF